MRFELPDHVLAVSHKLKKAKFESFVVGGSLRDIILGKKRSDWDFATNATPEDLLTIFPNGFYDNSFGTVGVPIEEGIKSPGGGEKNIFEITTYRSEAGFSDHRHPDKVVWGSTITEDLARRDFTINAMAYDPDKGIIDPYKGLEDIKNKIIRAVRNPQERFAEDALRMMRAIRFATELSFGIEEETFAAIERNSHLLPSISWERIRDEVFKILASKNAYGGFGKLRESGLLKHIFPEIEKCFGVEQKSPQRHHIYDVGTHLFKSLEFCPSKDPLVRLATLLHDVGKSVTHNKTEEGVITFYNHEIIGASIVRNIAFRMHLPKKDREKLVRLVRWHQFSVDEKQTDKALRRFIKNIGPGDLGDILDLRIGDRLGGGARETSWRLELFKKRLIEVQKQPFTVSDLKVSGHDVMNIYKITPGPFVGSILNILFGDVVDGKIPNTHDALIARMTQLKKDNPKAHV